jgi:hypothetical protein
MANVALELKRYDIFNLNALLYVSEVPDGFYVVFSSLFEVPLAYYIHLGEIAALG